MAEYLLDTTAIIDYLRRRPRTVEFIHQRLASEDEFGCCCVNVTEVLAGVRPHDIKVTEGFLESLRYYDVTRRLASVAGEFIRTYRQQGFTLAVADATVAAVARVHRLRLVTANVRHFPMLRNEVVELSG